MMGAGNVAPWLPLSWLGFAIIVGSLLGAWWAGRALPRFGIEGSYIWSIYPVAMLAGVAGAKLWSAGEALLAQGCVPLVQVLRGRSGATFYGGLILGTVAVIAKVAWDRKSLRAVTTALAPTLALSQAIGRIRRLLVGRGHRGKTSPPRGVAVPHPPPPPHDLRPSAPGH